MARKKTSQSRRRAAARARRGASTQTRGSASQDFNPDYTYIIQDLRRIGVLTASFIVVLVVLSFILR